MSFSPQQMRLDAHVPAPTDRSFAPLKSAMKDQFKTSSMYINWEPPAVPEPTLMPHTRIPGSTASGIIRLPRVVPPPKREVISWPPKLSTSHNFKPAMYPPHSYAGAHLERRVLCAGLGGIDPTM